MNNNINVITQKEELYNKCENMEELYDKYYLPLLEKHYKKTYILEQALDKIEKYVVNLKKNYIFWENDDFTNGRNAAYEMISDDLLKIIQKAKGDVKNEN